MTEQAAVFENRQGSQIGEARFLYRLFPGENTLSRVARKLLRQPQVVMSFVVFFVYLTIAILGYLQQIPDFQVAVGESYEPPQLSFAKFFGTDIFGYSILYKLFAGTKTAMTLGFLVTAIAIPVGIFLGSLAGYFGGKVDSFIVWLYSVVASVPYILLIISISYVLGKGLASVCIAMGCVYWVNLCRLIRGEVMKQKSRDYVLAAKLQGASDLLIIFKHILPNVFHLAIITASIMVLTAIKAEVILTYIGVGIQNGSSWGSMISEAPNELVNGYWWPLMAVVIMMFLIIYALNIIGDALRDALDPKLLD